MTVFPMVLGFLVLFTVVIFVIARFIVPTPSEIAATVDSRVMERVEQRIQPVGRVRTSPPEETTVAVAATPAEPRSGEEVYNLACAACHAIGVANAPKLGDAAAWAPRLAKGLDALVSSAINGIGSMPARGGNPTISDAEIRSAVEHMVK